MDNEEALANMSHEMLGQLGYDVTTCVKGTEALEFFRRHPDVFDLVITDYSTPQITGIDLAKEIQCIRSDIPIIVCSGYSQMIDEEKAKEMGISGFLMKPYIMCNLADAIRRASGKESGGAT